MTEPQQYDETARINIKSGLYSVFVPTRRIGGLGITRSVQGWFLEEILFAPTKIIRQARSTIGAIDDPADDDFGTRVITWLLMALSMILLGAWHGVMALGRQLIIIIVGLVLILKGDLGYLRMDPAPETA